MLVKVYNMAYKPAVKQYIELLKDILILVCEEKGLSTIGTKKDLAERLAEHDSKTFSYIRKGI